MYTHDLNLSRFISIYFFDMLCCNCGCHKFISSKITTLISYLASIKDGIKIQAKHFNKDRHAQQVHLGGGTPSYLSIEQIQTLTETIKYHFVFTNNDDFELATVIDPRTTSNADITSLAGIGFNRMILAYKILIHQYKKLLTEFKHKQIF